MALTLLLGGARSGKSKLAARLASDYGGPVTVVATAEPGDDEMTARIARHKRNRPSHWIVVEEPHDLEGALTIVPDDACLVIDCLTLWVSNLMGRDIPSDEIGERARSAAGMAAARRAHTIVVSNEVGSGIVPVNPLARSYRDLLGEVNSIFSEAAHRGLLLVAGRVLELKSPSDLVVGDEA